MRAKAVLATAFTATLVLPACGFPGWAVAAPNRNPDQVEAGTYTLDPLHAKILWAISHFGFSTYYGLFNKAEGRMELNPKAPRSSQVEVTIPVDSVLTGNAKLDEELKGADWFDAQKYPTITFRSTGVDLTGPDSARVAGELTMHGVTKPVVLSVTFEGAGTNPVDHKYTVGFNGTTVVDRTAFGISKYAPAVGSEVRITISAPFERQ